MVRIRHIYCELRFRLRGTFYSRYERIGDCSRGFRYGDARALQRFNFSRCSSLSAGNDRACVTHPPPGRRCFSCDECSHGFFAVRLNPFRGLFFGGPANLADQNHRVCARIVIKQLYTIEMRQTVNRITANPDAG